MIDNNDQDVAIVGIGFRLPGKSNSPIELWENLIDGFDGIIDITSDRWSSTFADTSEISSKFCGLVDLDEWMSFDPLFFGINPSEAKQIDPQQRVLLKSTYEAFEDAGIDPTSLRGSDTTVFIGASSTDYLVNNTDSNEPAINCFNTNLSGVSNRISYLYDFRGASLCVDTVCSSSLNAVHLGYESIKNSKTNNYSIVGGCNLILMPDTSRSFESIRITSRSGKCKAFDADDDGFIRSEGVVVLILKRLSLAIKDENQIYCVIKGSSSNVDGSLDKTNFFCPSKASQANNIIKAFESTNNQLQYSDIDFFELHGTGTPIGDPIEVEAVSSIFKQSKSPENPLLIGSIKSNIGHLEPASGVASLAKICLMYKHRQFVKNINFDKPNPNIRFDEWNVKVITENTPFPNDKKVSMAINSFGITGSNACVLFTEYVKPTFTTTADIESQPTSSYLIPISANSKNSLDQWRLLMLNNFEKYSNQFNFNDFVNYQVQCKSNKLASRMVLVAKNWEGVGKEQSYITTKNIKMGNIKEKEKSTALVFVFCGQGPQWNKMAIELYNHEPTFKQSIDTTDQILCKHFGYSVLSKLRSLEDDDTVGINLPSIAQPTIFMIQIALFELFTKNWGIQPSIIVGHSFGEISSAYCSGMIDLETACFIIYKRGVIQDKTIGSGKMLAIGLNKDQFEQQYSSYINQVEISCYNSPTSIVISGQKSVLLEISTIAKEKNIFSTMLGSLSAFHSSKQEMVKDEVLNEFKNITSTKPTIKTFSTVASNLFKSDDADDDGIDALNFDSNYIYENLRQPVLFEKTINNIFKYIENKDMGNNVIFLELSPHPTLTHYIKEMVPKVDNNQSEVNYFEDSSITVLSCLNKKKPNDLVDIQTTISQVYCNGFNVNFSIQLKSKNKPTNASFYLPRYQWDDSVYWRDSETSLNNRKFGPTSNQLGYRNELSPFISYTSYIDIGTEPYQFLKGHQSRGKVIFPGCGYLDCILKAFKTYDITIWNLDFKAPLELKEGYKQPLSTMIYASSKNEYRASFYYRDRISRKWILSASGRFSTTKQNSDIATEKIDIQSLKDQCNYTVLKRKELYEAIKVMSQLSLTDSFQSVEEAYYTSESCLCKISLDNVLSSYDNESFFNIGILDGSFQVLASVEDRKLHKYIYCYSEFVSKIGDSYCTKVITMLPDGTVLFSSPLVTCTSITPVKNTVSMVHPNEQLFSTCLQSIDSSLPISNSKLLNNSNNNSSINDVNPENDVEELNNEIEI